MKSLVIITTNEDFDGHRVLVREDSGQTVRPSDILMVGKSLNPRIPVPCEGGRIRSQSYLSLPESSVPPGVNAVAFLDERLKGEASLQRLVFCKLRDDDSDYEAYTMIRRKLYG